MRKFVLVILDGFGLRDAPEGNAYLLAETPTLDRLLQPPAMIPLQTSGAAVGLPPGVMGNSEVGHMNMGAGRVVPQGLVRINAAIGDGSLARHPDLQGLLQRTVSSGGTLHLLGLCSDGGVHSHLEHLEATLSLARQAGVKRLAYHAIMDGRDTSPRAGQGYLRQVAGWMEQIGLGRIATVSGRYYAMDRDRRWDRVERAYRMLVHGEGARYDDPQAVLEEAYGQGTGDEFILPAVVDPGLTLRPGDALLALNFRADRMRQLLRALTDPRFAPFKTDLLGLDVVTMTSYERAFDFPVLFPAPQLDNILPELLARAGYRQIRIAETEKYAHVTYFFNGGREEPVAGEDRHLVPSPKVATYDLQPEMSAAEVTGHACAVMEQGTHEALIMNLANLDMVGHTGDLQAGLRAMATVDACVGRLLAAAEAGGYAFFLTADHGNIEMMIDPDTGRPHTAHTTLDVPFVMLTPEGDRGLQGSGRLADIAPTILDYLGLDIPPEMNGRSRLVALHAAD